MEPDKSLKILIITTEYPNKIETVRSVFNKELVAHLQNRASIKIVAPVLLSMPFVKNHLNQIPKNEVIGGVEVYHPRYFVIPKIGRIFTGIIYFLSIFLTVKKIRKEFNFDTIYGIWAYPDGFASVLLSKIFRKPVGINILGCDVNHYPRFFLLRQLIKFTLKNADYVIAVSNDLKNKAIRLGVSSEKAARVINGVNLRKFYPMNQKESRIVLNLPLDKKLVLFIGRLSEEKGLQYLILAFNVVKKKYSIPPLLVIIGDGKDERNIRKMISKYNLSDSIKILSKVEHDKIIYWINSADLLCLPSLREGCPNIVLESLACGCPVVATTVGGIPEIISSDKLGFLVPLQNYDELAVFIIRAFDKIWNKEAISEEGRKRSWQDTANETSQLIRRFIN